MHRKKAKIFLCDRRKKDLLLATKKMMMLRKRLSWEKHFLHVAANKKEYLLKARLLLSACCKYFLLEAYLTSGKLQESFNVFSTNSLLRKSLRHAGIPVAYSKNLTKIISTKQNLPKKLPDLSVEISTEISIEISLAISFSF